MVRWICRSNTCPNCRQELPNDSLTREFERLLENPELRRLLSEIENDPLVVASSEVQEALNQTLEEEEYTLEGRIFRELLSQLGQVFW